MKFHTVTSFLLSLAVKQGLCLNKTSLRGGSSDTADSDNQDPWKPRELRGTASFSYDEIEGLLMPWEEIALELVDDTTGPKSQTVPGQVTDFRVLRPKTPGAHIDQLSFLLEQGGLLINRVTAKFTDGSTDVGGIDPAVFLRGKPKIVTVKLPGKLRDTITVIPRFLDAASGHFVEQVTFDGLGTTVGRGDGKNPRVITRCMTSTTDF